MGKKEKKHLPVVFWLVMTIVLINTEEKWLKDLYQHKRSEVNGLKTVKKTSIFPASKKKVFAKLLKLRTLQYIAYPYATFTPLDAADNMSWEVGSTSRFKFRLFGILPFGTHTIHVVRFGLDEGIYTHEGNEHVPTWNHEIILEELPGNKCRYTDKVDIDAGWKTIFIWIWANFFYAHRQRKWIKLLSRRN